MPRHHPLSAQQQMSRAIPGISTVPTKRILCPGTSLRRTRIGCYEPTNLLRFGDLSCNCLQLLNRFYSGSVVCDVIRGHFQRSWAFRISCVPECASKCTGPDFSTVFGRLRRVSPPRGPIHGVHGYWNGDAVHKRVATQYPLGQTRALAPGTRVEVGRVTEALPTRLRLRARVRPQRSCNVPGGLCQTIAPSTCNPLEYPP